MAEEELPGYGQYVEQVELRCGFYGVSGAQARSLATESGVLEKDYWPWLSYWPFYLTYPVTVAQGETLEFRCGSAEPWARGNVFASNAGFSAQPAGNVTSSSRLLASTHPGHEVRR